MAEAGAHPRKRPFKWKRSFTRVHQILITQQHGGVSSRKQSYLQIFTLQLVYLGTTAKEEMVPQTCIMR